MAELTKMVATVNLEPEHLNKIHDTFPDLEFVTCPERDKVPDVLTGAQALFGWSADIPLDRLPEFPELRWIQANNAGVNALLTPYIVESDLIVTNCAGVHATNISEHLLAMILAFARRLPTLVLGQADRRWTRLERERVFELGDQTLGILGLGSIGSGLAWRAHALGMRVIGLKRNQNELPAGVSQVFRPEQLPELLSQADHVAICLPLTPETRSLISTAEFEAMKPEAYLYNIGRGPIVDQDALIEALRSGQIAGAGLDVTDPEPLPADSPLWDLPNVLITCHNAGRSPHYWARATDLLIDNIDRFRRDEPMLNMVNKHDGY